MDTIPYLRDQASLLAEAKVKTRLGSTNRWTDAEYYTALNEVLLTWADHVKMPHIYTIASGWQASTYDYALPSYVRPPIRAELLRRIPYYEYEVESTTATWQEVPGYDVKPDGEGGQVLHLFAPPRSVDARIIYYSPNSRVPTTVPSTTGVLDDDDTSVQIDEAVDVDDVGFIKIGSEWMSYQGVTRGASTTTLNNLTRGLNGTTAAQHLNGVDVLWGVAADTLSLYKLLFDQWKAYLHAYYIQDGGTHETGRHEKAMGYYDQMAANYFATYRPQRRRGGLTLNRKTFAMMR